MPQQPGTGLPGSTQPGQACCGEWGPSCMQKEENLGARELWGGDPLGGPRRGAVVLGSAEERSPVAGTEL